jgi:hypothetical protein
MRYVTSNNERGERSARFSCSVQLPVGKSESKDSWYRFPVSIPSDRDGPAKISHPFVERSVDIFEETGPLGARPTRPASDRFSSEEVCRYSLRDVYRMPRSFLFEAAVLPASDRKKPLAFCELNAHRALRSSSRSICRRECTRHSAEAVYRLSKIQSRHRDIAFRACRFDIAESIITNLPTR